MKDTTSHQTSYVSEYSSMYDCLEKEMQQPYKERALQSQKYMFFWEYCSLFAVLLCFVTVFLSKESFVVSVLLMFLTGAISAGFESHRDNMRLIQLYIRDKLGHKILYSGLNPQKAIKEVYKEIKAWRFLEDTFRLRYE